MRTTRSAVALMYVLVASVVASACASGNRVGGDVGTMQYTAPDVPSVIGTRGIGPVTRRLAMLNAADSTLSAMGFWTSYIDSRRGELTTDWLFLDGPEFTSANVSHCDDGGHVGVRLSLAPSGSSDSTRYTLRGEVLVPKNARSDVRQLGATRASSSRAVRTPAEQERSARLAFMTAAQALAAAVRASEHQQDTLLTRVRDLAAEATYRVGTPAPSAAWELCGAGRP